MSSTSPAIPSQSQPALLAKLRKYVGLSGDLVNGKGDCVKVAVGEGPGDGVSVGVSVGVGVRVGGGKVLVIEGVNVG